MSEVRDDRRYTEKHEWAYATDEGHVRVGITDYAQNALGDIVFVDLPEVGQEVQSADSLGEVESTKSVSDIYSPVAGTVGAVNDRVEGTPEILNEAPYDDGWIVEIILEDGQNARDALDSLKTAEEYRAFADDSE